MKFSLTLVLVISALVANPARSQILDSDPDKLCFYADPIGNVPGICSYFQPETVYLMITRPSDPSGLIGFSCAFDLPADVVTLGFVPAGGVIPTNFFPELSYVYASPLPATGDTYIVGTANFMIIGPGMSEVLLRILSPGDQYFASYATAGNPQIPLWTPDWGNGMPGVPEVALWINWVNYCDYVVENEALSFGTVKSLFR